MDNEQEVGKAEELESLNNEDTDYIKTGLFHSNGNPIVRLKTKNPIGFTNG